MRRTRHGNMPKILRQYIRDVPDFPKKGILFKDITPLLGDPAMLRRAMDLLTERAAGLKPDKIVAIDSRGFIFGATVAYKLGVGFVPARKQGKLPHQVVRASYQLEYGADALEIHADAIGAGQRVLIIDDLLATGGTAQAAVRLVEQVGGEIAELVFVIELAFLEGRKRLAPHSVFSLLQY